MEAEFLGIEFATSESIETSNSWEFEGLSLALGISSQML